MKTKIVLILLLLSFNSLFSNSFDHKSELNLIPLMKDETLEWDYDSNLCTLNIYKMSNQLKELYDSVDYIEWNNWEVSKDRKKIIYWENWNNYENDKLANYYLLDGNSGKTIYLGKIHEGYSSSDCKYLIYKDTAVEPKVKFVLLNIETKNVEKEFFWKLKSEKYFSEEENTTYILRSNIPEYDFHFFIVGMGKYIFAEGYLNINQNEIVTISDDDDDERILNLDLLSKFELGK